MFVKSWGEVFFDIALGAGMYWAGKSSGKEEIRREWYEVDKNKQIEDLKKLVEDSHKIIDDMRKLQMHKKEEIK